MMIPRKRNRRCLGQPAPVASLAGILVMAASPENAHAYVDPGVGSYILQVVIGTIAAVGLGLKIFWGRIRQITRSLFSKNAGDGGPGA